MQTCSNCGSTLTCSCQLRTASDGKTCCTTCVAMYEQVLLANKNKP